MARTIASALAKNHPRMPSTSLATSMPPGLRGGVRFVDSAASLTGTLLHDCSCAAGETVISGGTHVAANNNIR